MEIQPGPTGTYYLLKQGRKFGEVTFYPGYPKPAISYDTPPGLTMVEEQQVLQLPNPWPDAPGA